MLSSRSLDQLGRSASRATSLLVTAIAVITGLWDVRGTCAADELPPILAVADREALTAELNRQLAAAERKVAAQPDQSASYSARGDARFFLGRFDEAVADYDQMLTLEPALAITHWRRGIALYYAEDFVAAAEQFNQYHKFDQVDRENGIWRYLSQANSVGLEQARRDLIQYRSADRPPLPAVYRMFSGDVSPEETWKQLSREQPAGIDPEQIRFYGGLYVGLYHESLGQHSQALEPLRAAVETRWPRTSGYGPNYMWHVARLHAERIRSRLADPTAADSDPGE